MFRNPTLPAALSFAAGIAVLQTRAALPAPMSCATLACAAALPALAAIAAWRRRPFNQDGMSPFAFACVVMCAALAGFVWAALLARERLEDRLAPAWEGRDIAVVGTVEGLPASSARGVRFLFNVEHVPALEDKKTQAEDLPSLHLPSPYLSPPRLPSPQLPSHLSLAWYAGRDGSARPPLLMPGQRWQFTVRLTRPHGNANPYGFDYELQLLEQGIGATGYVRPIAAVSPRMLDSFTPTASHTLQNLRLYLRDKITAALAQANARHAGVIAALVVGEQRGIARTDWEVFRRTGVSHLVAI